LGWPILQYPTSQASENQTLDEVRQTLNKQRSTKPIGAIVVEPVNSQTGHSLRSQFITDLGTIAHESGAALVVDETNTGCGATGTSFWAYSGSAADYLTFGKRTQATGYFFNSNKGSIVRTGGSEFDVALFTQIKKEIDGANLVELVGRVGKSLLT
jgi:4-aminobutyrate aminotransferase-like enzyme